MLCFHKQVKFWITFNEPWVFTVMGYGTGEMAPGGKNLATDPYTAGHNVLLAHAEAYHRYNDTYKASQKGKYLMAITEAVGIQATTRLSLICQPDTG